MAAKIDVGQKAPDFELVAADGRKVKLSDFRGVKNVVLFFYPKDDTPGCTVEACTFRDAYEEFAAAGAEVIGISADSTESHGRFASKYKLPMVLLSDRDGTVREAYGTKSLFGLLPGRVTFLIDKGGVVRHVLSSQLRVKEHVSSALSVLRGLDQAASGEPIAAL